MVRPTFFTPIDDSVRSAMERTGFRFRRLFPGADDVTPTMWRLWLGFNASHGLGVFTSGLVCPPIAVHDYTLVDRIGALQPLTISFPAVYFVVAGPLPVLRPGARHGRRLRVLHRCRAGGMS
jgi:hypothetical protein